MKNKESLRSVSKNLGKVRPKRVQRAGGELRRCTSSLLSRACHGSFWQQCGAVAVAPVPRSSERPAASRDQWAVGRPFVQNWPPLDWTQAEERAQDDL